MCPQAVVFGKFRRFAKTSESTRRYIGIVLQNQSLAGVESAIVGSGQWVVGGAESVDRATKIKDATAGRAHLPDAGVSRVSGGCDANPGQQRREKVTKRPGEHPPRCSREAVTGQGSNLYWHFAPCLPITARMNHRSSWRLLFALTNFILCSAPIVPATAQEPSIDNLLKKLPPPEKLVKTPMQRALQQEDPALKDSLGREIVSALGQRDLGRATELTRQLSARYPRSVAVHVLLGVLLADTRRAPEGVVEVRKAIALQADSAFAWFALGSIEAGEQRFAAALPHFQKVAALEPKNPIAWLFVSYCADRAGRKAEAATAAKQTTVVAPAYAPGWLWLAHAEKELGNTSQCLRAILRAADLSPDSAYMLATVGYTYINLNRIPEAVGPLQRAVRFSPNDFLVQSQLGFCLMMSGQTDAALDHLRKGAKLAPAYAPVWEHLGLAYSKQGRHGDAVTAFERATKIMPNYAQAWQHLAEEYRLVGQPADAEQAGLRAARLKNASSSRLKKKG